MNGGRKKVIRSAEKNGERTDTMEKSDIRYQAYVSILEEELKPAMDVRSRSPSLTARQSREKCSADSRRR